MAHVCTSVYRAFLLFGVWHALLALCRAGPVKYSSGPGNIKGDVLVLDVTSLWFQGTHPVYPVYDSPNQCADACKSLPGCNAWTFCNNTKAMIGPSGEWLGKGCGSGCPQYAKSNPPLVSDNLSGSNWKLPLTGFGPWGATARCAWIYNDTFQDTGAWPGGMCTLKKVADPSNPTYWPKDKNDGWVSGVIIKPPSCAGTTPAACEGCLGSSNPEACITCAKSSKVIPAKVMATLTGNPAGSQCVMCYTKSADPNKCSSCILQGSPCQFCPLDTFPAGPVDQCIACASKYEADHSANRYGAETSNGCRVCFSLDNPQQRAKCISCYDKARKVVGPADLADAVQSCSTCATSAADFTACENCILSKPYGTGCATCALMLKMPSDQSLCYKCRTEGKVLDSGCSTCLGSLSDPREKQTCLSCMRDPNISSAGKSNCFYCHRWYDTPEGVSKCVKCLATPQKDYYAACSGL